MPPAAIREAKQPRAHVYASGLGRRPNILLTLKTQEGDAKRVQWTVLTRGNPCQGFPHAALRRHSCFAVAKTNWKSYCMDLRTIFLNLNRKLKAGHPRHSWVLLQFLRSYARVVLLRNKSIFDASNGKGFLTFFHLRELRSPAESRGVKEQKTVHPPAQRENAPFLAPLPRLRLPALRAAFSPKWNSGN